MGGSWRGAIKEAGGDLNCSRAVEALVFVWSRMTGGAESLVAVSGMACEFITHTGVLASSRLLSENTVTVGLLED